MTNRHMRDEFGVSSGETVPAVPGGEPLGPHAVKRRLRTAMAVRRRVMTMAELDRAARMLCDATLARLPPGTTTVAAYLSVGTEPGTRQLLASLTAAGVGVVLPIVTADFDLDWAPFDPTLLRPARLGLIEPATRPIGRDAIVHVDTIICPGVAATRMGRRLGRGGGCYDKALGRADPGTLRMLLLYDDELVADLPVEEHDEPVDVVVLPSQTIETSARRP